ncbi:MAG: EscU/YscU/HrcU family type III secretion system export apparatus switch protein, partial [Treponema sp.]|nr:EscU/YscU/HrcU family type III secretion system export apparatus switch protein [Treponema sp.]
MKVPFLRILTTNLTNQHEAEAKYSGMCSCCSCGSWLKKSETSSGKKLLSGDELYEAALGMSLQWFAAEDEGRTFDPTDTTYRKAREEGRVSKSQDLTASLGLLLPGIALVFLAPWMLRNSVELVRFFFTRLSELDPLADRVSAGVAMRYFARLTAPLLAVGVVAGLFSNIAQVGF